MKKLTLILSLLLVVGGLYYAYQVVSPKPMPKPSPDTFTLDQLSEHKDKTNCWIAIDQKVYDVTPFVASGFHPGEEAILRGCGKDATELFNTRPMAQNPSSHSERARSMLPKYFIGNLTLN